MSREQFEAWLEAEYKHLESSKYTDVVPHIKYGFFMAWQAATSAMEAKCAALAAENTALKAMSDDRRTFIMNGVQLGYIKVPTVETDPALETIRAAVSPQDPTPATDAFLAEVRAQGVEMFAIEWGGHDSPYGQDAYNFAAKLRQEAAQ